MLETKEQKQIFAGSLALVVILGAVSFWHKPYIKEQQIKSGNNQSVLNSQQYIDYLRSANIDQKASKELFQTILTKEQIRQAVEEKFQVAQKIQPIIVDEAKIKTSSVNSPKAVNDYLTASISQAYAFNTDTKNTSQKLFSDDKTAAQQIQPKLKNTLAHLYALNVPKDAVPLHKALISAYSAYSDLIESSRSFDSANPEQNDKIWPQVYKNYSIANNSAKNYSDELNRLAGKYKISSIEVKSYAHADTDEETAGNILIPGAQAIFGLGDTTFNFTLGDIPRIITDSVKEGLRSAFLQFMGTMLNTLVTKIEQNYAIANFLYYTDALVNGQYANDYLNKYVNDPLDRSIVKKFLPQFSCGKTPNLTSLYQAKAVSYLGFEPSTLDPKDPDYYSKMARVGDFYSSPSGWQAYYQDLASKTESEAQKAAGQELVSPGLKTPRNTIQSTISSSINNIVSAEGAAFSSLLQLGINNADSIISDVVANLTQTLVNKFVFQGVSSNGGNIAVYKEQPTCISTPVLNPVLALPPSQYQQPQASLTQEAVLAQQCSAITKVDADCTSAILSELYNCSLTPSQHTGTQTCQALANSPYVQNILNNCSNLDEPTAQCNNFSSYVSQIH